MNLLTNLTQRWPVLSVVLAALSAIGPLHAADYTSTGVVISGQASSLIFTNAPGQVLIRGNMHTAKVISSDARMTGRRRIIVDGYYNADGTATLSGVCYQEVGIWNDTTFTPSGGVWEIRYTGVMGIDNSLLLRFAGSGSGGSIDGLRLEETMTRGPAPTPDNATEPYHYAGSIRPAPVTTQAVLDNFNDPGLGNWSESGPGRGRLTEANGNLTVHGDWPGIVTRAHSDTYYWATRGVDWSIADGRTLEWRVNLISLTEGATNAAALVVGNSGLGSVYLFYKGTTFIELAKYHGSGLSVFFHENLGLKNTNVVLSLTMTRANTSLILTTRVLDQAGPGAVLYQRSFVDTSSADRCLSRGELLTLSGMDLFVIPDAPGLPLFYGDTGLLDAWQYTDGTQPAIDVVYDNFEWRTYETPLLSIERSVTLLVPDTCDVEQAPAVNGPWTPVVETSVPGLKRVSVPSQTQTGIFRAVARP